MRVSLGLTPARYVLQVFVPFVHFPNGVRCETIPAGDTVDVNQEQQTVTVTIGPDAAAETRHILKILSAGPGQLESVAAPSHHYEV